LIFQIGGVRAAECSTAGNSPRHAGLDPASSDCCGFESPFSDLRPCQRVFDRWRADYNLRRPHEAPAYAVPAARYQPGPRRFPERLPAVEYETGVAVRKVSGDGTVPFKGQPYRIGKALKQPYVALRATTQDDNTRSITAPGK